LAEHAAEYEWRGDGEEAEVVLYAPDDAAFERVLPATSLPGVESPVYAAASPEGFGWTAVSSSHVAPELLSLPARGVLLVAGTRSENLRVDARELANRVLRDLPEIGSRLPPLNEAGVGRLCESGARAAAEDGLIEEEDLMLLGALPGDSDALGRRALSAGPRDWQETAIPELSVVSQVFDTDGAESLGLEPGALAVVIRVDGGDLGRLVLAAHTERLQARSEDFGASLDLPAAPAESGEAQDLLAALYAAANFADARAARTVWTLRRLLGEAAGELDVRATWRVGGVEERDGRLVHRKGLALVEDEVALVSGRYAALGTGNMFSSAPPFGVLEGEDRWPWEEAGLLERLAALEFPEG
jgi:tRNA-splicing ligase RtcB (3'-phosphate/5'-hydroxy nucleic acid ligase)